MLTFCAQNWTFKNRKSARFSSVLRELKGFNKVYMPLATRNFKNIILLILKDKVASTACVFFRCTKLFSHKNKVAPPPKARDFRRFFHWIFCTTPMFDVELSTVGKLFLHAFQRYQARYLKRPWCKCPTVFLLRKSRKIAQNRAILRKAFRHISTPQQLLSSSLSPLESSFHALSNGAKLDILSARGVELWTFFFFENHEKSLKIAQSCFSTFASTTPVKNTQKSNKMSNCLAGY